jgi:hypothetical protein
MKSEVKLIDLGMNAMRLTKNGCLTKINESDDTWNSSNFADKGEFTIRLDLLIAEDSGEVYHIPAKSVTVTLAFEEVKEIADFIQPTAGTAVGGPSIDEVLKDATAGWEACEQRRLQAEHFHKIAKELNANEKLYDIPDRLPEVIKEQK